MSLLKNEDLFLVNQNDDTYTVSYEELKKGTDSTMLNDDDKFLINRTDGVTGDVSIHTVTWGQIQADAGTAPVIDSVTLVEDEPETRDRFTNESFTTTYVMAEDGKPASTKSIRAWVEGSLVGDPDANVRRYLKLDQGTLNVIELQSAETFYTPIATAAPKITFGATLGTADAPDDLLPPGTSIQTEIKATNGIDPDSIVQSNPVTPIKVTGPKATMYGLRFDPSRSTKLYKSMDINSSVCTVSLWYKYDGNQNQYDGIITNNTDIATDNEVLLGYGTATNSFYIYNVNIGNLGFAPTKNVWQHIVVKFDGLNVQGYLNGVPGTPITMSQELDLQGVAVGWNPPTGTGEHIGGYLSDVYFVEGQALEPETFGEDFEGKWGPLDSSKVKTNIGDFGTNGFFLPFNADDGIGNDDSGNDNHFADENFQTQPANVYSKNVTYKGDYFAGSAEEIFNGDPTFTKLVVTQTDGSGFIKWTGTLENVTSLSVFTERQGYVEVVGNLGTIQQAYSFAGSSAECTITPENLAAVGTTITSISTNWTNHLTVNQVYMYSIKVNGSLLVDEEDAGIDAVKDTPMTSYAVLNTGANGNLEATSATSITYLGEAGTDYYYEEDGAGKIHTGAGAFTSTSGKTYNFGQQPLANPLATDNGDGTITVEDEVIDSGDPAYDERYFWSTYAESSSGMVNAHQAFNGNQANGWSTVDNYDDVLWSPPPVLTGTQMRVRSGQTNMVITLTNTDDEEFNTTIPTSGSTGTLDFTGTIKTVLFSGTPPLWNSAVNWITIDGIILRDPVGKPGGTYGTLYQTWEQWNDYVTLFADNPEHVAKFEAIKAALESYEGDLRQYRGQLLTRLVTSGFTLHEIDSMDLINIEDATEWQANTGYEDGALVTYNDEYWFALSSSYNNSPDDNDPEDWVSLTP